MSQRGGSKPASEGEQLREEALDGPAGRRLIAGFVAEVSELYPAWDASLGPSADPQEFRRPGGCFLIAYEQNEPVGCGGLKRLDEKTAEIKRMYVAPHARGRGLARRILVRLEQVAGETGYARVRLDTGVEQPQALHLYRSSGYREIPDYNGNPAASYWFEKRLLEVDRH